MYEAPHEQISLHTTLNRLNTTLNRSLMGLFSLTIVSSVKNRKVLAFLGKEHPFGIASELAVQWVMRLALNVLAL